MVRPYVCNNSLKLGGVNTKKPLIIGIKALILTYYYIVVKVR